MDAYEIDLASLQRHERGQNQRALRSAMAVYDFDCASGAVTLAPGRWVEWTTESPLCVHDILCDGFPVGEINLTIAENVAWVFWMGRPFGLRKPLALGPARVRMLLDSLRRYHPEVTRISFLKTGGTRKRHPAEQSFLLVGEKWRSASHTTAREDGDRLGRALEAGRARLPEAP